jgi:hypothetical protein
MHASQFVYHTGCGRWSYDRLSASSSTFVNIADLSTRTVNDIG